MSAFDPKKPVTVGEANHEAEPRDPQRDGKNPVPGPSRTGTAAHALLDDAAGRQKSETEEALERATGDDRSAAD